MSPRTSHRNITTHCWDENCSTAPRVEPSYTIYHVLAELYTCLELCVSQPEPVRNAFVHVQPGRHATLLSQHFLVYQRLVTKYIEPADLQEVRWQSSMTLSNASLVCAVFHEASRAKTYLRMVKVRKQRATRIWIVHPPPLLDSS